MKTRWIVTGLLAAAMLAVGTGMQGSSSTSFVDIRGYILPARTVAQLGDRLVLLDTRTGAVDLLRGDPGMAASGARCNWTRRVPPVREAHSGLLEVQVVGNGVFLVDVKQGGTWVLRWRGNENGSWVRIQDAK